MGERAIAIARALVVVAGTLPVALLASVLGALALPLSQDLRWAIGFVAIIPLWVTGMCLAALDERAWRAALALGGLGAALAVLVSELA